jgi:hypothetical protein
MNASMVADKPIKRMANPAWGKQLDMRTDLVSLVENLTEFFQNYKIRWGYEKRSTYPDPRKEVCKLLSEFTQKHEGAFDIPVTRYIKKLNEQKRETLSEIDDYRRCLIGIVKRVSFNYFKRYHPDSPSAIPVLEFSVLMNPLEKWTKLHKSIILYCDLYLDGRDTTFYEEILEKFDQYMANNSFYLQGVKLYPFEKVQEHSDMNRMETIRRWFNLVDEQIRYELIDGFKQRIPEVRYRYDDDVCSDAEFMKIQKEFARY